MFAQIVNSLNAPPTRAPAAAPAPSLSQATTSLTGKSLGDLSPEEREALRLEGQQYLAQVRAQQSTPAPSQSPAVATTPSPATASNVSPPQPKSLAIEEEGAYDASPVVR